MTSDISGALDKAECVYRAMAAAKPGYVEIELGELLQYAKEAHSPIVSGIAKRVSKDVAKYFVSLVKREVWPEI